MKCVEFGGMKPGKHGHSIQFIAKSCIKQRTGELQGLVQGMSKSATVGGRPTGALGFRRYWGNLGRGIVGFHKASMVFLFPTFVNDEAQRTLETEENKSEN